MSEPLRRIAEAVAYVTEDEVVVVLGALGATVGRQRGAQQVPRTPLPPPGGPTNIRSEVEWV